MGRPYAAARSDHAASSSRPRSTHARKCSSAASGHVELAVLRPSVGALGESHLLLAQRRAVRLPGVLLVGAAGRDVRPHDDQGGPVLDLDRGPRRLLDPVQLEILAEVLHVPAVGLEAGADVLGERGARVALDRDVVVVVERDQPPEPEVAGQRARLRGHALLHVAVARDRERAMVDQGVLAVVEARGQHALGQRQPDAHRDPLPERPGGRLDPGGVPVLGMPGGRDSRAGGSSRRSSSVRPYPVRYSIEYSSIEACPADSTKRSRSGHAGLAGLWRMMRV